MTTLETLPTIIQGGMGIGVSDWRLARAVSKLGQLGVVSGTALDSVVARKLQLGDPDGSLRRALSHFAWPDMAQRVLDAYFIPGGKSPKEPFRLAPVPVLQMGRSSIELMVVSNFVEIFLAKEGHSGPVGVNFLEKIQLPTLPSLLGVMLAGVDFVLMGAGIPLSIPGILDGLSRWDAVELRLHVENNPRHLNFSHHFDPKEFFAGDLPELPRPRFLAIISSHILGKSLVRKATGMVDGFVVEGHTAGGHNAPPRKTATSHAQSGPQYGPKDIPDVTKIRDLGRPFWLAGGYASPARLKEALDQGAAGIQVGTAFAFCTESRVLPEMKREVLRQCNAGTVEVFTDFRASSTGYPFKLVALDNTITSMGKPEDRKRVCDLGYLRQFYCDGGAEVGYRCCSEPVRAYLAKGGRQEETIGKHCLCNGLLATIGLGQIRGDGLEIPMVTAGEDFSCVSRIVERSGMDYSAADVLDYLES